MLLTSNLGLEKTIKLQAAAKDYAEKRLIIH
jgi:hypothetical protein